MLFSILAPRAATMYNLQDHSERNWLPAYALTIQIIVTFLVWVRIISRFSTNGRPGFDDVLIFLAWILGTGVTAVSILSVYKYGFNKHIWGVQVKDWWKGGLVAYIIEVLFFWSTCFTKVSVLMFYRRLVAGTYSRKFKWSIWAAIAFVIAYTISFFILTFVTCRPFVALWRQYDPDWLAAHPHFYCTENGITTKISELAGALSVITDFYSVMLPAALIMQIRITKRQKYGLLFIFGMGYLVVAAGIARTIYLGRAQAEVYDKSWAAFNIFVASIAECNVAIACACAPSLKAVFGRFFRDMSSKYGSGGNSKISSNDESNNNGSHININQSSDSINKAEGHMETLKRTTSKLKAKFSGEKKEIIEVNEESSFKEAHEYGLSSLEPVASGLGDGLVSPMEREFSRIMHQRNSQMVDMKDMPQRIPLTPQNVRNVTGPGSYIISPSPSVSSDDEASLIDKRAYSRDGDIPYGLPEREESRSSNVWPRIQQAAVPDIPPQFQNPLPNLGPSRGIASPLSENSFYENHVVQPSTASSTSPRPRRKVRRKLSKEKGNENKTTYPSM